MPTSTLFDTAVRVAGTGATAPHSWLVARVRLYRMRHDLTRILGRKLIADAGHSSADRPLP